MWEELLPVVPTPSDFMLAWTVTARFFPLPMDCNPDFSGSVTSMDAVFPGRRCAKSGICSFVHWRDVASCAFAAGVPLLMALAFDEVNERAIGILALKRERQHDVRKVIVAVVRIHNVDGDRSAGIHRLMRWMTSPTSVSGSASVRGSVRARFAVAAQGTLTTRREHRDVPSAAPRTVGCRGASPFTVTDKEPPAARDPTSHPSAPSVGFGSVVMAERPSGT